MAFSSALVGTSSWGSTFSSAIVGQSVWQSRARADNYGTGGLYVRPADIVVASPYVRPTPKIKVKLGGSLVRARSGRIRLSRNAPIEWSITIDYAAGNYGPTSGVATAARQKLANWSFEFSIAGEIYRITNLVAEEYAIDDDGTITINGTDLSHKLSVTSHMGDVDCVSLKTVLQQIDANYGVRIVTGFDTLLDYYHRVGRPIDWVGELSRPLADWSMEGSSLRVTPVEYGKPPRWSFTEREHLEVLTYKAAPWAIRNRAIVVKEVPAQGLLLEVERNAASVYEAGFFGQQGPFQFPEPAIYIQARVIRAERGSLDTFSYRGTHGGPVSGLDAIGGYYGGPTPASAVQFNYTPGSAAIFNGSQIWTPGFKVRFFGQIAARAQRGAGSGGKWTGNVAVAGGLVQPYENVFVTTFHTDLVGQQLANAYAYEGALKAESVTWQTQLAPWVKKGFNVRLTERRRTGYNGKHVFIQAIEHTFDRTKDADGRIADSGTTTYEGSALLT